MLEPASDLLPDAVATALGVSAKATIWTGPQGMTSEVAFVDDQGMKSVLKRCRDRRYIEWLRREHQVLVALAECRLRIPRVLGYHEVQQNGQITDTWLLMTRLPGEPLWDLLLRSSPFERSRLFRKLGKLLRELHSTPAPKAFHGQRPRQRWIERMLHEARNNLPWCDGSPELLADLEATRPAPVPEVLIHGDMCLDNVLVDSEGAMALIDWPTGDLGDPRCDVAIALATEPEIHLSEAEIAAFYEGCGGEEIDAATRKWFVGLYEFF